MPMARAGLPSHCIADLSWVDIQAYLADDDLALVPVASLEQHGRHLPLSTDTITALEVSRRAAALAGVLHTPVMWAGYSPQHMGHVGEGLGTVTLRATTFQNVCHDIARSLIHHGFNRIVFVAGHGSNVKVIDPVLRKLKYETGALVGYYKAYAERYLGFLRGLMENPEQETPGWHASELETSQVLAHDARLVRMDRAIREKTHTPAWLPEAFVKQDGAPDVEFKGYQYFVFPMDHREFSPSGCIGNPFTATAEKGEEALSRFARHLAEALEELKKAPVKVFNREFVDRAL
jgi:creatinine amidohydrolase